jgi:tRNA A-37 threonylcarbamoyl transferase component Bud32
VSLLGRRFALVREIGSGGMSTVFLGRDEVLDRPVAIKVLNPGLEAAEVSSRFRREGRTAARLSHPNIVQVYDAGEDELDGQEVSYIVVEYVPGGDLKDLIDRRGPLPGAILSRIGADVAAGLAHAHERGVIHRDIKPENVLMDEYGSPKLTDFGIARALDADHSTSTGSYLGTALYSSPEQLRGDGVTPKSDVYSLGATLYHAAVGEPPFSGDPLQVATQQVAKPPIPPRARGAHIGERLEALILGCLAKDPAARPEAETLHERLLQISAAAAGAGPAGISGVARATGAARAAGAAGVKAVKRGLSRRGPPELQGPPEITIHVPTRTFRAGARQRTALAGIMVALLLIAVIAAGAWALLGPHVGGEAARPVARVIEPQRKTPDAPAARPAAKAAGSPAAGSPAASANAAGANAAGANAAKVSAGKPDEPALPADQAEQAVFDMYYQESFDRAEESWSHLSQRLQNEIGSVEQWAQQEDIYTFTYMEFTSYPTATVSGDTAKVTFEVRLDHTWGSELLSGTWVCVVEDGEWKLDHLENEHTVRL